MLLAEEEEHPSCNPANRIQDTQLGKITNTSIISCFINQMLNEGMPHHLCQLFDESTR